MKFGVGLKADNQTYFTANYITGLGDEYSVLVGSKTFGESVKDVSILVDMREPYTGTPKQKSPRLAKGKRRFKKHGLEWSIEDALLIEVRPNVEAIAKATSMAEVVQALLTSFQEVVPALKKMKIDAFDMDGFISDFSSFLQGKITKP